MPGIMHFKEAEGRWRKGRKRRQGGRRVKREREGKEEKKHNPKYEAQSVLAGCL